MSGRKTTTLPSTEGCGVVTTRIRVRSNSSYTSVWNTAAQHPAIATTATNRSGRELTPWGRLLDMNAAIKGGSSHSFGRRCGVDGRPQLGL